MIDGCGWMWMGCISSLIPRSKYYSPPLILHVNPTRTQCIPSEDSLYREYIYSTQYIVWLHSPLAETQYSTLPRRPDPEGHATMYQTRRTGLSNYLNQAYFGQKQTKRFKGGLNCNRCGKSNISAG